MSIEAKTRPALVVFFLFLAACSSSAPQSSGPKANVPQPEMAIEQVVGPGEAGYPYGGFEVQYRFEIANRAEVPLTLKRITISTVNPQGGSYTLVPPFDYYFNKVIPARSTDKVEFWARAQGYGTSPRDTEPVTVKGVAYFQAADGYVNQVFVREMMQQP